MGVSGNMVTLVLRNQEMKVTKRMPYIMLPLMFLVNAKVVIKKPAVPSQKVGLCMVPERQAPVMGSEWEQAVRVTRVDGLGPIRERPW